ncbi:hypothetical protein [Actinoplanes xinjiangensis]|uniref:hypothetical protein n=1 Tax=Actinoplanes xinjiangensis TaxID=512350 RepID=UPI00343367B8
MTVLATASLAIGVPGIAHAQQTQSIVNVTIRNDTSILLKLQEFNVTAGGREFGPSAIIEPAGYDYFYLTIGADEGSSGDVRYIGENYSFAFFWSKPDVGDESFSCRVPSHLTCTYEAIKEPEPGVAFTVRD